MIVVNFLFIRFPFSTCGLTQILLKAVKRFYNVLLFICSHSIV